MSALTQPVASRPLRLLVVMPSWVGDAVMATPTLRMLREALRGSFIGALARPGLDELLDGSGLFDEVHVARASGIMGPKFAAAKVRPRRYDAALLLTNSFSTALTVRIAGIPRRIGYDRDARGILLTDRMAAPVRPDGAWATVPAVDYYHAIVERFLLAPARGEGVPDPLGGRALSAKPHRAFMELGTTPAQAAFSRAILEKGGVGPDESYVLLNPGANDVAKRWPADRFAALALRLHASFGLRAVINGSPGEMAIVDQVAAACPAARPVCLSRLGITLGALKGIIARARLVVTNDTGPRHVAAAMGTPLVSLFGPTDHRWAIIPTRPGSDEALIVADPTLPEELVANDHPERCRIDRIEVERVEEACARVLAERMPRSFRALAE
jgi:heptosyltransferase-2